MKHYTSMTGLVDSHCHLDRLDLEPFDNSFDRLIQQTLQSGVEHMLCVSIDTESYPSMLSLVEPYPVISISVGVHPNDRERHEPTPEQLVAMADHPKNVAIGETGLDYFRSEGDLEWQRERFRRHIRAALICDKPLIIHTRAAREDTIRIMQEEGAADIGGVKAVAIGDMNNDGRNDIVISCESANPPKFDDLGWICSECCFSFLLNRF